MPKFESLEDWIEKRWGTQGALAEEIGMAQNTISSWLSGRSRIKPPIQKVLKDLGYDGPFPDGGKEVTREDLEALRQDLRTHQAWMLEELRKGQVALAAVLQEVLKRVPPLK